MIRRILLLLALGSQLIALSAQTAKTRANLYTQIDSSLPSNSSGAITAATLRTVFKDTIASAYNPATDAGTFTTAGTAPAWLLPTFTASTIATNQNGLGWDENGRVTLQTPVGALQFYTTGSPSEAVIYWPGRIITSAIDASSITGGISAANIVAPLGVETINADIISRSLVPPLDKWQQGESYAGTAGLPYVVDTDYNPGFNQYEPTVGVYFPQAVVTAGGTSQINQLSGRYRTVAQVKADLAIAATDLTATGTKDSTTYLRGDNTWATVSGGGSSATTRNVTTTGSLLSTDTIIICTGAGGITLTLPAANALSPRPIQLEIINRTSGTVILARAGSDLFEGFTTATITAGSSWSITSDASANWYLY